MIRWLDDATVKNDGPFFNESEAEDINKLNDTNAPQLDTPDKEAKDNMDNKKAWKDSFLQVAPLGKNNIDGVAPKVSPMTCGKALAETCGKVLGRMCLDCYMKNSKAIVIKADGLVCDLKEAKAICATNAHLDKTIVAEEEGHKEISKRSGKPARFAVRSGAVFSRRPDTDRPVVRA